MSSDDEVDIDDENKAMNTVQPEGHGQQTTTLTIEDHETRTSTAQKSSIFSRLPQIRVQHIINAIIIVTVGPLLYLLEYGYIPGTKLGFTCKDPLLSHKYTGDTITVLILFIGTVLVPLLMILLVEYLNHKSVRLRDVWVYYKEFIIGEAFVLLITEIMKIIVGEHRPHFFDTCRPVENESCLEGTFISYYTCQPKTTYSNYFIVDTSRSFPSGHSSVSTFSAIFAAYVVQSRLPTAKTGYLLKPLLVAVCLTWGILCSLSRIVDRRHHWWDVFTGIALGVLGAIYTIYFLNKKLYGSMNEAQNKISTSTTTLLDVKNKDATSVII